MDTPVTVVTGPAGVGKTDALLERYVDVLAEGEPGATLWLAPTWRSAARVRERLPSSRLRACFSPGVMTFDQFAASVLAASSETVRPLSQLLRRQLLRRLVDEQLARGELDHFRPIARTTGLIEQVSEFIRELKRLDIWPERFLEACHQRGLSPKDRELAAIYGAYQDCLNEHHLYDAEGRFWAARRLLRERVERPWNRLRLVVADGFADFLEAQHEIFEILADRVDELFVSLPFEEEPPRDDLFAKTRETLAKLQRRHPGLIHQRLSRPSPLGAKRPEGLRHLEANLFLNPRRVVDAPSTRGLEILAASRSLGEMERVAVRVKELLCRSTEQGGAVPPGDILVVYRSLRGREAMAREVFSGMGIPVALEAGHTLDEAPAMAAFVGLLRADVEDWPFRGLLGVLTNGYFRPGWTSWREGASRVVVERSVRTLQVAGGRKALLAELSRQAERSDEEPVDEESSWRLRHSDATRAHAVLSRLTEALDRLPERATLIEWGVAWRDLARTTGIRADRSATGPEPRAGVVSDDRAWRALEEALAAARRLDEWLGREAQAVLLDRNEAFQALVELLHGVQLRDGGDESGRVRVLSAASTRAIRVGYLFFAGLAEQSFPQPERNDRLYGEAEQQELIHHGLPLPAHGERNHDEMLLFHEVVTRADEAILFSYPAMDESAQPLSASPYLDEVEQACGRMSIHRTDIPDLSPVPIDPEPWSVDDFRVRAVADALAGDVGLLAGLFRVEERGTACSVERIDAGLRMIHARQLREFGPTEGILDGSRVGPKLGERFGPEHPLAATSLENYAGCPYRFFAAKVLRLAPLEDLTLDVDYLSRGRLVHEALAKIHARINAEEGRAYSPSGLDAESFDLLATEATDEALRGRPKHGFEGAMTELDRRLWLRWAADYHRQHRAYDDLWGDFTEPPVPTHFEVAFGRPDAGEWPSTDQPLVLDCDGQRVLLTGRVDRIDVGKVGDQTVFNLIDYKTGRSASFSAESAARGTSLQLPLYALAVEKVLLADVAAVPWQVGYWMVQKAGFRSIPDLRLATKSEGGVQSSVEWEELRTMMTGTIGGLVEGIRAGRFPVNSTDEHCTRNCPYRTICRIGHIRALEK